MNTNIEKLKRSMKAMFLIVEEDVAKDINQRINSVMNDYVSDIKTLETENKKLKACVEFYADPNKWLSREQWDVGEGTCLANDKELVNHLYEGSSYNSELGGKCARQCLKELES